MWGRISSPYTLDTINCPRIFVKCFHCKRAFAPIDCRNSLLPIPAFALGAAKGPPVMPRRLTTESLETSQNVRGTAPPLYANLNVHPPSNTGTSCNRRAWPPSTRTIMEEKLKETKILVNSILTASENPLSLGQLEAEYKMMENEFIPFKDFGFKSLLEFLQSCTDCVKITHFGGTAQLQPIVDEASKHIRDLVENQKKDPSKKVSYKITQAVEENILRLLARAPEHKLPLSRLSSWYTKSYGRSLPAPKGKLVAWLGTSNRFAILTLDKNLKIIEPLSHVDLSRYRPSNSLPESSMAALRDSVLNALSGWSKPLEPARACSASRPPPPCAQSRSPRPAQAPTALRPELRQFLINIMMKNPESTSVPELHKACEDSYGPIGIRTVLNWLVSMEQCLVIGSEKGRVYLRPEHRPTAIVPNVSTMIRSPSPQKQTIDPPTRTVTSVASATIPKETLRITVHTSGDPEAPPTNGWERVVETTSSTYEAANGRSIGSVEAQPLNNKPNGFDRVLEGISGLCVTDIIDVIEMLRRRPKVPLDQLLAKFEETFERSIEPSDGVESLLMSLSALGLLKVAPNSDVSLASPVCLKTFEYEPGEWLDVTEDDAFWNKFIGDDVLTEGISMTGKVACYNETGFTFAPNWCPPDQLYSRTAIKPQGNYIYSNGEQKLRAVALTSISVAGHWLIRLPDCEQFKTCREEQLFVGPPQPMFDVVPIGRCPQVGESIKLKIVQVSPTMTFACVGHEEPCCKLISKLDSNFNFRVLHWDNQRFVPREDLAKLSLHKGLTSMDWSAIDHGENFAASSWMRDIKDPFFIPMVELVELLETTGFREDAIHDLLLI